MTFKVLKDKVIITLNNKFWRDENYGDNLSRLISYLKKDNINKIHVFFDDKLTFDWILREFIDDILIRNMNSNTKIIVHCKKHQYYHIIDKLNFSKVKIVSDAKNVSFQINNEIQLRINVTNYVSMQRLYIL